MAEKLYKRKFTEEDLVVVESYMRKNATSIFIEVWQNGSDDGDVYEIKASSLKSAIHQASNYYDSVNSKQNVVELIMRDNIGDYVTIYHIEKNREGLTFEIIKYAEADIKWGYLISFYKGGNREVINKKRYKTQKEAFDAARQHINKLSSLHGLPNDRFEVYTHIMN